MIVLIDNYDSFSYNLYQLLGAFDPEIKVVRNDELSVQEIERLNPQALVLSPGPGKPEDSGICIEAIKYFAGKIPILGVCLGHQAIVCAFGGKVGYAPCIMHGKTSIISLDTTSRLFANFDTSLKVARYHSLCAIKEYLPKCLRVTAISKDDEIMALEHKEYAIFGVQFHPESIMTERGADMIKNILSHIEVTN